MALDPRPSSPGDPMLPHPLDRLPPEPAAAPNPPAFAASPPSVPAVPVVSATTTPSLSPSLSPRKCEGCSVSHAGTYGSGRFCSATCAKKVGARHKWAARATSGSRRPGPARRALPDAPCESCAKLHDRSYGSGRFCSVHCARRVAATRKWEKSRADKSKRLEAIRPAMLAPPPQAQHPPAAAALAGKRRRVVARGMQTLNISDAAQPSFYVTGASYAVPPPGQRPTTAEHVSPAPPHAMAPPAAAYLPPAPQAPFPYGLQPTGAPSALESSLVGQVVYGSHPLSPGTAGPPRLFYGHTVPAYRVVHPAGLDSAAYSVLSQSPSPPPVTLPRHHLQYPPVSPLHRPLPPNYVFPRNPAFEMEAVSASVSPSPFDETHGSDPVLPDERHVAGFNAGMAMSMGVAGAIGPHPIPLEGNVEGSESAARALLCLRATNSKRC